MALLDSDRTQEIFLIVGDSWRGPNRKWIFFFFISVVLAWPLYFAVSLYVANLSSTTYTPPTLTQAEERAPIEEVEKGFVRISGNSYSAYVKLHNSNLEWGIPKLDYRAEVKASDGTVIASVTSSTFILPSSEKLVVLPRFTADRVPTQLNFSILGSKFILKPTAFPNVQIDVQRSQIVHQGDDTVFSATIKNVSPFTIKQLDITTVIYNQKSEIVAINYTNLNDVASGELRSFQSDWAANIPGQLRAEVTPEVNMFTKDILKTQGPVSPF